MKKHDDQVKQKVDHEIEDLKKQIEEWKGKYLRALADYQNLERRTIEEKKDIRSYAAEHILGRILPVFDTFKRAQDHLKDPGLELAFKELTAAFEEQGVERMVVLGKSFNPHEMECVEVVEGEENKVIEEVLPGYVLHGKLLRVAQVKVGKNSNKTT